MVVTSSVIHSSPLLRPDCVLFLVLRYRSVEPFRRVWFDPCSFGVRGDTPVFIGPVAPGHRTVVSTHATSEACALVAGKLGYLLHLYSRSLRPESEE